MPQTLGSRRRTQNWKKYASDAGNTRISKYRMIFFQIDIFISLFKFWRYITNMRYYIRYIWYSCIGHTCIWKTAREPRPRASCKSKIIVTILKTAPTSAKTIKPSGNSSYLVSHIINRHFNIYLKCQKK